MRPRIFGFASLVAVLLLAALGARAFADDGVDQDLVGPELADEQGLAYPKLGSLLSDLAEQYEAAAGAPETDGGEGATTFDPDGAGNMAATVHGLSITYSGDAARVVRAIEQHGGSVRNILDGYIEAYVPSTGLAALAQVEGVSWAREFAPAMPLRGSVTSAGVRAHVADAWHDAGIRGQGVKVGVIDYSYSNTSRDGFVGLKKLLGTEVPASVTARCYTDVGKPTSNLDNCTRTGGFLSAFLGGANDHGTSVAEVVMDVAPEADLYIANPTTWGDLRSSVEWMHGQGVQVIVYSVIWAYHGPADGTTPYKYGPLNTVKWAADNGIIWINGAGNSGNRTWFGAFADSDSDNVHEWTSQAKEYQTFTGRAGSSFWAFMRWDDSWGGAGKDLALILVKDPGTASEKEVKRANDTQSGGSKHTPYEQMRVTVPETGTYGFKVVKNSGAAPSWLQLAVWEIRISDPTDGYSIMSPADSPHPGMLGVGGTSASDTTHMYSWFSSKGPTPDGRIKPDIVGASCVRTVTKQSGDGFCGTSASGPHVAGLAALIVQQNPEFTPAQTASYLKSHAARRGTPVPNSTWGYGFAKLPVFTCHDQINRAGATSGTWAATCPSASDATRHSRYYSFTLPQSSSVTIDLTSSGVDSQLMLRRGYNAQQGVPLHQDDNSGSGTNARISQTLAAGRYTIEATASAAGQTGAFTLSTAGLSSGPTISITADGDITEGSNAVFTLTANPAPSAPLTVSVKVWSSGDFGVTAGAKSVIIPTTGSAKLSLPTTGDNIAEPHGSVAASVNIGLSYVVSPAASQAAVAVSDDDQPIISVSADRDVTEGEDVWFTVSAHRQVAVSQVRLTLSKHGNVFDPSRPPPSEKHVDLASDGTARFKIATQNDQRGEGHGSLTVTIQERPHYSAPAAGATASVKIWDNDPIPCVEQLVRDRTMLSTWTTDCQSAVNTKTTARLSRYYTFVLNQQATVTIEQRSPFFDSYLYLRSGYAARTGVPLHEDDNSRGTDKDAKISATLAAGWYTVEATTKEPAQTGRFAFYLSGLPAQASGQVVSIAAGPDIEEGGDAEFTISADPPPASPLSVSVLVSQRGDLGLTTGTRTVTIPVGGSTALNVATVDDSEVEVGGSVIVSVIPGNGYGVSGRQGAAAVEVADNEIPAECVEHITGDDKFLGEWKHGCESYTRASRYARFYTFELTQRSKVSIDLISKQHPVTLTSVDNFLYVRSGKNVGVGRAVLSDDDSGNGRNARISFATLDPGWYTIEATTFGIRSTGTFELIVSGLPASNLPLLTITPGPDITEGEKATFTLTATPAKNYLLILGVRIDQRGDFGVTTGYSSKARFPANSGSITFTVDTTDDNVDEADGLVRVTIDDSTAWRVDPQHRTAEVVVVDNDDSSAVDPNVVNKVKALASQIQHGTAHVNRWNRVLWAFGEHDGTGVTGGKMTAAEAQVMASTHSSPVWGEVVTELTKLEAATGSQTPVLSISAGSGITEGGTASFTITATPAPASPLTVNVGVTESGSYGASGAATVTVSGATTTYTVTTTDDSTDEADGSVTATLQTGTDYTVSSTNGAATVSVSDNDVPELSISAGSAITEGGTASFTITASPVPASPLTVNVGVTESGSYGASGAATVTVSGATTTYTVTTADDTVDEADGSVTATLQSGTDYTVSSTNGAATVSVSDNDVPELSISAGSAITEGGTASFTITANPAPASPLAVNIGVSETGSYGASGAATVTVSGATTTYTVTTTDDRTDEADGSVTATLQSGTDYTVSSTNGAATVTVADNDSAPQGYTVDSTVISKVKALAGQVQHGPSHVNRWNRVLWAFGEHNGVGVTGGKMTAEQAQQMADRHSSPVWDLVVTELTNMEHAGNGVVPVLSITGGSAITEGGTVSFTITATPAPGAPITVKVGVSQSGSFGASGAATITVSGASTTYTINTSDDSTDEPNGSVTATLQNGSGYKVSATNGAATVTVSDNDDPPVVVVPELSIAPGTAITEGGTASFTITATPVPASPLTVKVGVTESGDFGASGAATVTVSSASTTYTITTSDDSTDEPHGTVTATLQDGSGYTVSSRNGSAGVVVLDNDDPPVVVPVLSITGGGGITEGGTASFTITATPAPSSPITVKVGVSQGGSFGASGAATVTVSGASTTYSITTTDDSVDEPNGTVTATLRDGSGYTVSSTNSAATVSVADNDDPPVVVPVLSITGGGGITEGGTASFTITATPAPSAPITVKVGVSQSGSFGASGAATVTVSGASTTYTITTANDNVDEADGSVTATLQDGSGYTVSATNGAATVRVADDDVPLLSISAGGGITEGGTASFTITANPVPASPITVKVGVSQGGSFGASGAATVTVSGASTTYTITTANDNVDEADGSVTATLQDGSGYTVSATSGAATVVVADNDDPPTQSQAITVSVDDASGEEGGYLVFTARLARASAEELRVRWNTATAWDEDERARRRDDYEDSSDVLVFAPGETEQTGRIWIESDAAAESDELFVVELFLPGSWWPPDATGLMTIVDGN